MGRFDLYNVGEIRSAECVKLHETDGIGIEGAPWPSAAARSAPAAAAWFSRFVSIVRFDEGGVVIVSTGLFARLISRGSCLTIAYGT